MSGSHVVTITPERPDALESVALIGELDEHLARRYPSASRHGFSVDRLLAQGVAFFLLRVDGLPVGCGGLLLVGHEYGEVKRMWVRPAFRGSGFGKQMLDHLADVARDNGVNVLRLETGIHQQEAIALYEATGFVRIPPFGTYTDDPLSLCYEKQLA